MGNVAAADTGNHILHILANIWLCVRVRVRACVRVCVQADDKGEIDSERGEGRLGEHTRRRQTTRGESKGSDGWCEDDVKMLV